MNEAVINYIVALHTDPYPSPDYRICRTPADLDDYFYPFLIHEYQHTDRPLIPLGEDTESLPDGTPFCCTLSHTPGTGRLIYVTDAPTMSHYRQIRAALNIHSLFHNYLHDVEVYDRIGLSIGTFTDTMVRAYNLCLGGGGDDEEESRAGRGSLSLKILAYRHLSMHMTSFKDTVYPYSIPKALDWLWRAEALLHPEDRKVKYCKCGHYQRSHEIRGKAEKHIGNCDTCDCPKYRWAKPPAPSPREKALSQLYLKTTNLLQSLESHADVDPWKRIKDWHKSDHDTDDESGESPLPAWAVSELESAIGPVPRPSIAHVPEDKLAYYAIRDADATLRFNHFLDTYKPWIWLD